MHDAEKPARGRGRPTTFTQERADAVIDLMADQQLGLGDACRKLGIPKSTFQSWILADPTGDLADKYRRAQVIRALVMSDQCLEIVDDSRLDLIPGPRGPVLDHAHIRRCKARVNYRMWFAAKWLPARLGGKAEDSGRASVEFLIGD